MLRQCLYRLAIAVTICVCLWCAYVLLGSYVLGAVYPYRHAPSGELIPYILLGIELLYYAGIALIIIWATLPYAHFGRLFRSFFAHKLSRHLGLESMTCVEKDIDPALLSKSSQFKGVDSGPHFIFKYRNSLVRFSIYGYVLVEFDRDVFSGSTIVTDDLVASHKRDVEKVFQMKRVDLVDKDFEKRFDVFSNDQVEARFLIHPRMIEELTALSYQHHSFRVSFYDKRYILFYISGMHVNLVPHFYKPIKDTVFFDDAVYAIEHVISIVDLLSEAFNRKR